GTAATAIAAGFFLAFVVAPCLANGFPFHATVLGKTCIFGGNDRFFQGRTDGFVWCPFILNTYWPILVRQNAGLFAHICTAAGIEDTVPEDPGEQIDL